MRYIWHICMRLCSVRQQLSVAARRHKRLNIVMKNELNLPQGAEYYKADSPDRTSVGQRVSLLYTSGRLADLTIHLQGHKETIQAHRLILAMSSPVFEAKLYGSSAVGKELHLEDESPEAFRWLLDFIYCDKTHFPSTTIALEVSHLASKYEIEELKAACSRYLKMVLSDANYLKVYNAAVQLNNKDLIYQCSQILQGSADNVFSSKHITQLSQWALKHLLQQPCSVVTEVKVFNAVLTWGRHQLGSRRMSYSASDLRQKIEDFLPHIRFLTMTTDEFVEHVVTADIFTPHEACAIMKGILRLPDITLPSFCNPIRQKRNIQSSFDVTSY